MKFWTTLFCVMALPAWASTTLCTFTQECLEGEPCAETAFEMELTAKPGADGQWSMSTSAETLDGTGYTAGSLSHLVFLGESAGHFITITDSFDARYATHMEGPFSITYHGTCEGK